MVIGSTWPQNMAIKRVLIHNASRGKKFVYRMGMEFMCKLLPCDVMIDMIYLLELQELWQSGDAYEH
eukprot:1147935-Pelagomonas_calceolata.AAC.5